LVHFPITMEVVLIGSAISITIGVLLAVVMDCSKFMEKVLYPILTVSQTIPTMCLAPMFVLWFGYSTVNRVLVVILSTFFSVTINVFDGFLSTRKDMQELMMTYGANRREIFWKLRVPTALPYFFSALKIALPWSVVGAAIAEYLGAPGGLGEFSKRKMMEFDGAGLFAPILLISIVALLMIAIVKVIEKRVVKWVGEY